MFSPINKQLRHISPLSASLTVFRQLHLAAFGEGTQPCSMSLQFVLRRKEKKEKKMKKIQRTVGMETFWIPSRARKTVRGTTSSGDALRDVCSAFRSYQLKQTFLSQKERGEKEEDLQMGFV